MAEGKGRVLVIAGSDSGGGAGIQGDIKTITCLGGYAATAITALTAQNTQGVYAVQDVPAAFIKQQITLVLEDIGADAFKTGMLHKASVIKAVADVISSPRRGEAGRGAGLGDADSKTQTANRESPPPNLPPAGGGISLVLDPVMFAKGGHALLEQDALDTLKGYLLPLARLVTPNVPEAEFLAGMTIHTADDMCEAAQRILKLGCRAVLVKGGHLPGGTVTDILLNESGLERFAGPRMDTPHTHGTGCALASAIATGLAQGMPLAGAVKRARAYVQKAIEAAPGLGKGHGPLGHGHTVGEFIY